MADEAAIIGTTVGLISSRNVIASALEPPRRPADLSLVAPNQPPMLPSQDNPLPAVAYVHAPPVPVLNVQGQIIGSIINVAV